MYILHIYTLYDSLFFNSCIFFFFEKKNTNNNNNNNGRKFVRFYYYYYYEIWYMIRYCECPVECASLAFKTTTIIITIYPGVIFCCHLDIYPQVTHSKSSYFSYTATVYGNIQSKYIRRLIQIKFNFFFDCRLFLDIFCRCTYLYN